MDHQFLIPPFYRAPVERKRVAARPCGAVALVRIGREQLVPSASLGRSVRNLALVDPRVMRVGVLDDELSSEEHHRAWTEFDLHAVTRVSRPTLTEFRRLLTDASEAVARIRRRLLAVPLGPHVVDGIGRLVAHGLDAEPAAHLPDRHVRLDSRMPCPPASEWFRLGKALHAAMELQRQDASPVTRVAYRLGYHDGSSLSRQLHGVFGRRPTFVRPRLGWLWLLDDWWARHEQVWVRRRG